jgi:KDO2-lipid IV(A) lauroyltransferase
LQTIARGAPGSARQMLATLRGGRALAILIDQDAPVDGVWVPFFGRPAYTPVAAHALATRFGAIVLPVFAERLASGQHRVVIHATLDLLPDPVASVGAMTAAIEAQIRRQPSQWVWMHRRWRRQPPGS